ncbi:MAG: hypothetical protein WCI11_21355, partial [Candidatus Methylumidiphilus sp.]
VASHPRPTIIRPPAALSSPLSHSGNNPAYQATNRQPATQQPHILAANLQNVKRMRETQQF